MAIPQKGAVQSEADAGSMQAYGRSIGAHPAGGSAKPAKPVKRAKAKAAPKHGLKKPMPKKTPRY